MNTNADGAQDAVVSFKKAKRVLIGVQFGASALVISSLLIAHVVGDDFWGPFIGQAGPWVAVGLIFANTVYGLALGLWEKPSATPVR